MIVIGGRYFISDNVLRGIIDAKKEGKTSPASILLYILKKISSENNIKMKFFCTKTILDILEKEWEKLDSEPAIKRMVIEKNDSTKYGTREENLLDVVSDVALSEVPNYTCFLVTEGEINIMVDKNNKLKFTGFEITTPEKLLIKLEIYPFGKNIISKIQQAIDSYC